MMLSCRCTNWSVRMCSMLASDPVSRLSTTITRLPLRSSSSARCEPRKPAPPVIRQVDTGLQSSVPTCRRAPPSLGSGSPGSPLSSLTRGGAMAAARFIERLNEQIAYEFSASQQYIANAVYYDEQTLPRLAAFFYAQAVEERNHAMMMVQYLLDSDAQVTI